jgi:DNA-binding MarR family transcriptional regulator
MFSISCRDKSKTKAALSSLKSRITSQNQSILRQMDFLLTYQQSIHRLPAMQRLLCEPGPRYQPLIELLRTAETLWNSSRVFFARWDLSPSQFNVLNLLHEQPGGCTQISLSRKLIMHRSNITGLVDRLEMRGLVRRKEIPGDRRAFNIVLTPEGKKLVTAIQPHYYHAAEIVWNGISVERTRQILSDLRAIGENASTIAAENHHSK